MSHAGVAGTSGYGTGLTRHLKAAGIYVTAICRMSRDKRTRTYVDRRTKEGKTKKEILRCLKRHIAREAYRILASLSLNKLPISVP